MTLKDMLHRHEGYEQFVYNDTKGIPTVGYGRNLRDKGINRAEADFLLDNDILQIRTECAALYDWFETLDSVRQDAIIDMGMMGVKKLAGFVNMIAALRRKDWQDASNEILNSEWRREVGDRAFDVAELMLTGEYPSGS